MAAGWNKSVLWRQITSTTKYIFSLVKYVPVNDPCGTYDKIEEEITLNHLVINEIIWDHLGFK